MAIVAVSVEREPAGAPACIAVKEAEALPVCRQEAAAAVQALAPVLDGAGAPRPAAGAPAAAAAASAAPPPPESAAEALLPSVEAALGSALFGAGGRGAAVAVLADAAALLDLGRPAAVRALADLQRLHQLALAAEVAELQAPTSGEGRAAAPRPPRRAAAPAATAREGAHSTHRSAGPGSTGRRSRVGKGSRGARRSLQAGELKLRFLLSWANEQPGAMYRALARDVRAELERHSEGLQARSGAERSPGSGALAGLPPRAGAEAQGDVERGQTMAAPRVLVQELPLDGDR